MLCTIAEDGVIHQIEYACDGIPKLSRISYLKVSENATDWELKVIAKWLEKFHPKRTRVIDDLEYIYWYRYEYLGLDQDCTEHIP